MKKYSGGTATDRSVLCDLCGGGTYTFPSGSIWCPNEGCVAGGHFVKRVAFERAPGAAPIKSRRANPVAAAESARRIEERRSDKEAARLLKDDFNVGLDAFIGKDSR